MSSLRVALCQIAVGADKAANIARASAAVAAAASASSPAKLVVLPECFNCPYGTKYFADYAEPIPAPGADCKSIASDASPTVRAMAEAAAASKVWLVAGSIPERDPASGRLYNTSATFAPDGTLRGLHRKMHLFKINTETVKFDESEVLTAGDSPTIVDCAAGGNEQDSMSQVKLGVGICFDIRYPQLAMCYHEQGTNVLVYPGAFNMVTGPKHWELAARSRAVDAQQFVILCSPARDTSADYVAYGHSLVMDPWGDIVAKADGGEETTVFADLNLDLVQEVRRRLPISAGVRNDLYRLQWQTPSAAS